MSDFVFLGNSPWLDFVDSELNDGGVTRDLLGSFDDLLRWGQEAGLLGEVQARDFSSATSAAERDALLRAARGFRAGLRKAAVRLSRGEGLPAGLLDSINALLAEHPRLLALRRSGKTWRLESRGAAPSARGLLSLIAEDFARFLTHADLSLLRRCANEQCSIFFYDTSKNHKRRWCSMDFCGNRAKAAGHRARQAG